MTRAVNNDHLTDLVRDFPHIRAIDIAQRLGCAESTVHNWITKRADPKPSPSWSVAPILVWRKELEGNVETQNIEPVKSTSDVMMFIVTVPKNKVSSLKNIIGLFNGEITEV